MKPALLACAAVLALSNAAYAQPSAGPQPYPMPPKTEAPQDTPYPGLLKVQVDATDLDHHIFRVHETIPVAKAGPMTVLYPQWLPGNHAANGPMKNIGGVVFHAGGRVIPWMRDSVDVFAFHIDVPPGVASVDVDFDLLSAVTGDEGRIVMTPEMLSLQWINLAMYPAGHFARRVRSSPACGSPRAGRPSPRLRPPGRRTA